MSSTYNPSILRQLSNDPTTLLLPTPNLHNYLRLGIMSAGTSVHSEEAFIPVVCAPDHAILCNLLWLTCEQEELDDDLDSSYGDE